MENGVIGANAVHLVMMKETPKITYPKLNPNVFAPENAKVDQMWHVSVLEVLLKWIIVNYQAAEALFVHGQIGQNVPLHVEVEAIENGHGNALVLEIVMV